MVVRFTPTTQTASPSKVRFTPTAPAPAPKKKAGFFGRVKADVEEAGQVRGQKMRDILAAGKKGQQSKFETAAQFGGQLIGSAFEAPMSVIKQATPGIVKKVAKKAIFNPIAKYVEKSAQTLSDIPAVQKFATGRTAEEIYADAARGDAEANAVPIELRPGAERFARNIEAIPEYANLIPAPKATKFIAGATEKTLGTGTRQVLGATTKFAEKQAVKRAGKVAKEIDTLAGKIAQGTPEDIPVFKKALSNIEVKGVKTYKQLKDRINEKIKLLSEKVDEVISKNPAVRTISNLKTVVNAGDQKITRNFVNDALKQLDDYFTKTNNIKGMAQVQTILQRGNTTGLTIKDINDLARLHGRELSGFNANGELASGLSRQGAENTRSGLKAVARDLYGDKLFQEADGEISSLIRAKDLVETMETNVNKLRQKIQPRGLGQRAGRLMFQVANLFSFGGLKGFLEAALIPRGQGFKTLNALDLEKYLSKNLKKIESLLDANLPENDLVKRLQDVITSAEQERRLLLPAPAQANLPRNTINQLPSTEQPIVSPFSLKNLREAVEPHIPDDQLPVIKTGRLPKRKPISGPVVDYGSSPKVFTPENSSPFKKIKDYSVDGITYSEYKIPDQYPSLLTVAKSESGYRIQSIQVPENLQRQGIATRTYEALNKESLANTGYPLKSTITSKLSPSSKALWEKFVSNGKAKLHKGKTGFGDFYQFID